MNVAACLLAYAAVLTWICPPVLERVTSHGVAPRLGLAVWLTAIGTALIAWVGALCATALAVTSSIIRGTVVDYCPELFGFPEVATDPVKLLVSLTTALALVATMWVTCRTVAGIYRLRTHSVEHARAIRIVGTATTRPDVVVIADRRPAAYCVAGRPHAIVVTSAAVHTLDRRQLAAVLAHEDAHIRGRHHQLLIVLRAVAAALPRLPLFAAGTSAATRLLEMCADDVAVRLYGAAPLVESLVRLAELRAAPAHLGAADTAVTARVTRLARLAGPAQQWRHRTALTATVAVTVMAPATVALLCAH
ncbi:M56 family metallopeptidase [Mycobacterium sp. CVI_P3]|uniref:M56 family metallopeptidase n=1 Tax=Mycobacterium pinniadriaticum TaxID=2994102 RepID=A0ABT3S7P3_9MYCO|nr:M56 family metallopeptidase [Mycobacterium pinniadriaticum]MCX2929098.1 M56 family metallopeptidase [Mycobacterium pinniadriaticum]MCX2935523.1 M56 family metallopeptidase [Mycobacterium pinniadriaticum]